MVTLSKSIGGYGFPLALTLFKPELDIWKPGEHNGTFRGNQVALVAAKAAIELTIKDNIEKEVRRKSKIIEDFLNKNIKPISKEIEIRGIGFIWGIDVKEEKLSNKIVKECFKNGLILERAGRNNCVVKIMPALITDDEILLEGLKIIENAIKKVYGDK